MLNVSESQHISWAIHSDNKARTRNPLSSKNIESVCEAGCLPSAQTLDREDSPLSFFVPCIALPTRNPRRKSKRAIGTIKKV